MLFLFCQVFWLEHLHCYESFLSIQAGANASSKVGAGVSSAGGLKTPRVSERFEPKRLFHVDGARCTQSGSHEPLLHVMAMH